MIALLSSVFWFALRSIRQADSMNAMVAHTEEVLRNAETLRVCRASLRNSYWAFQQGHRATVLEKFDGRRTELRETLQKLRSLTADNRRQQELLGQLAPALTEEADFLATELRLQTANPVPHRGFPVEMVVVAPAADRTLQLIDEFENNDRALPQPLSRRSAERSPRRRYPDCCRHP